MRILGAILVALIVLIQYPLWLGKGGWLRAWEVDRQVEAQKAKNHQLEDRNAALAAEVKDLKQGTEAIEERARGELGMLRPDEIFFQYVPGKPGSAPDNAAKLP
ncbi:MAG TPA: cell division protein FtsB [Burkholderiales bacterium]|nr:cell division protein FtsB [Burkholderiales bacterium]